MSNVRLTSMGVMTAVALLSNSHGVWAQDWPQWAGPNRDNKVTGFTAPKTWPKALTKKWRTTVGIGEASPVLVGDKVYVFARQGGDEVTVCLDASTGKEVWKDKYATAAVMGGDVGMTGLGPGPRSTPAVAEGKICTFGVNAVLSCLEAGTGKVVWRKETGNVNQFHTRSSPMIVDGKCIVYTAGLTAFDLASGAPKWQWKGGGVNVYGSPVLMTVDGTKQVVTPAAGAIGGISLADGKVLWQVKFGGNQFLNTYGTPIIDGDTVIYFGPGANGGAVALKIEKKGDGFNATELWKIKQGTFTTNVPVLKDRMLFGIAASQSMFCLDAQTGAMRWTDKTQRTEQGVVLAAGSVLLARTRDGNLIAFLPSNKEYKELAKYRVADTPSGTCPIVAGNRVFVKDRDALTLWTIE